MKKLAWFSDGLKSSVHSHPRMTSSRLKTVKRTGGVPKYKPLFGHLATDTGGSRKGRGGGGGVRGCNPPPSPLWAAQPKRAHRSSSLFSVTSAVLSFCAGREFHVNGHKRVEVRRTTDHDEKRKKNKLDRSTGRDASMHASKGPQITWSLSRSATENVYHDLEVTELKWPERESRDSSQEIASTSQKEQQRQARSQVKWIFKGKAILLACMLQTLKSSVLTSFCTFESIGVRSLYRTVICSISCCAGQLQFCFSEDFRDCFAVITNRMQATLAQVSIPGKCKICKWQVYCVL